MSDTQALYDQLKKRMRDTITLETVLETLDYDDQTVLPEKGAEYRGEQAALIQGLRHERLTDPRVGELLEKLESSSNSWATDAPERTNIREWRRDYDRQNKLARSLVEEVSEAGVTGRSAWIKARSENDFSIFQPSLEKMFDLQKQVAESLGYDTEPYDALLDQYEIEAKTSQVAEVFKDLRNELVPMIHTIQQAPRQPDMSKIEGHFPIDRQQEFNRKVAAAIGFDFKRGAMGIAAHPFCCTLGPSDIRITTRFEENRFDTAFSSTIHEAGHGLYEQNMLTEHWGTPQCYYSSLGIHESQSRFWENQVGRTEAFWEKWYPIAQEYFEDLRSVSMEEYLFAMNAANPSLIRVDADEITYNLHIMIRFEVERAVFNGDLKIEDIPAAWNEKYREYLGVEVPNDAQGCLQDVHWSIGIMGYFPTYALGNIYAAQFTAAMERDLESIDTLIEQERYPEILGWLRENVHRHGRHLTPVELVTRASGEAPTSRHLVDYLKNRYGKLYGIEL